VRGHHLPEVAVARALRLVLAGQACPTWSWPGHVPAAAGRYAAVSAATIAWARAAAALLARARRLCARGPSWLAV